MLGFHYVVPLCFSKGETIVRMMPLVNCSYVYFEIEMYCHNLVALSSPFNSLCSTV